MKTKDLLFGTMVVILSCTAGPQTNTDPEAVASASSFVQRFYDWYVPAALSDSSGPAWNRVLRPTPFAFSPDLLDALRTDSAAQAGVAGLIVGLDGDPFLAAQDPCERYQVGATTRKGASYFVEVYGNCQRDGKRRPDVVTELVRRNESWIFANFHYPQNGDLLTLLRSLHQQLLGGQ